MLDMNNVLFNSRGGVVFNYLVVFAQESTGMD